MRDCGRRVDGCLPARAMSAPRSRLFTARVVTARLVTVLAAVGVLLVGRPAPAAADTAGFSLPTASVRMVDGVYKLDAVARLRLSAPVRRALENGVPLTITWQVTIDRHRSWWFDAQAAEIVQRYRLEYHELSLQYVVTNLNTGERRAYTRLSVALDQIGTLIGFPLVDRMLVKPPRDYAGFARVRLEHDTLPLPLRLDALLSSDWDLESQWQTWSFD